ncbi:3-hydroxyacyl-CoA dehydrogenase NAD-binding domain-containing protein [Streptomyces spiramenti]|uniref:3-hydroxyacyl-CoA dehydrogenase n=1 Tax=Streptomyces spiramenti TaxID=2720606 RepID=A0ABX1AIN1_9ACTN|nr:3-hydroxyacyl-CoA dehydrogenase NAD-binding domain-containing protein [Streptomyces spiramenti]NJP65776.1 3-hydroxyacyl-CoA dehydrogenase [Streptomyces spiramenti]
MTAPAASAADPDAGPIHWHRGADGIVTLTMDAPGRTANTMDAAFVTALTAAADRLEGERDTVRGIIVTSAKETFFAGGDLDELIAAGPEDARQVFDFATALKRALRRIETLGVPVVAAVNGTALGGGLELALACHHRIVLDGPDTRLGLPEVTLGLLPGGGGVARTVRLLGIADALRHVLLEGTRHTPSRALELGLVHQVVTSPEEMLGAARAHIDAHPASRQPWDEEGYRIPGGTPATRSLAAVLPSFAAHLVRRTGGAPLPAPRNILAAAVEGAQVDFEGAQLIESRYFTELVVGQTSKNMTQAFFFDLRTVNAGAARPEGEPAHRVRRVGVVGAGMMGAGIAHVCARAGIDVVLQDVSREAALRGRAHAERLVAASVARGRMTEAEAAALTARITATDTIEDLAGCEVVVEAVFEDTALKHQVLAAVERVVGESALLCTNTSTLPVGGLAEAVGRPEDFLGLHFFSPVHRMPLVEIVRGARTGDRALARAFDLVRQIGRTPIVVNDGRGFFTSRVIARFLQEGVAMVGEGVAPSSVEQAAARAGYPTGVLALLDELTLTLPRRVRAEDRAAASAAGEEWVPHPADALLDRMVEEYGRTGRAGGAGFYEYGEDGARAGLWPELGERLAPGGRVELPMADLTERLLFVEALDSIRLLEEGVLTSVADANVGSLLGIGFPPWTGGVLQYVNGYPGGLDGFVARARELADRYGPRFAPPALLLAKAAAGELFGEVRYRPAPEVPAVV